MKVIQVCPSYYPTIGGVQFHVKQLSEHLAKKGLEVEVYTTNSGERLKSIEVINGIKVTRVFSPNNSYYFSPAVLPLLREAKADIVHAHNIGSFTFMFAAYAKAKNKIPLVSSFYFHGKGASRFQNLFYSPYIKIFGKYALRHTDLLICLSSYERSMISNHFRLCGKTAIIQAGLRFSPPVCSLLNRATRKKITFVGRLDEYKGVQYLIVAFSKVLREIDCQLYIIGKGSFEPYLRRLIEKLGISQYVTFSRKTGDDIIFEYCTSDVVVIPSKVETFNLAAIEALSCGTPVITTSVGEGETLIKNGWCIGLLNPTDPDEICEKIKTILLNGQRVTEERAGIMQKYSYDKIAENTYSLYKKLLK
jgi:glycosyltransferase involved in cell wall biosynthesis